MAKIIPSSFIVFSLAGAVFLTGCAPGNRNRSGGAFLLRPHAASVAQHSLLELAFQLPRAPSNPFLTPGPLVYFTAPDGRRELRRGFYRGGGIWLVRFRPRTAGTWTFEASNPPGPPLSGSFQCRPGAGLEQVRQNPANRYRWVRASGKPYFPLGIQECIDSSSGVPIFFVDGEGRDDGSAKRIDADAFFRLYGQAGFNLFRYSQRNCSPPLFDTLEAYREADMNITDLLLEAAHRHGFSVLFGFFGYHCHWYEGSAPGKLWHWLRRKTGAAPEALESLDPVVMALERRFLDYAVARWGEYVSFWELLNERRADARWTEAMARHVHAVDPLRRPVTTSWDDPGVAELDFLAPHWYTSEPAAESDIRVRDQAARWKAFGKPVLFGEHGNNGMNWDPGSAGRMRVRLWSALFHEVAMILWNTSWAKSGMYEGVYTPGQAANIYIGPQERAYVRALADFQSRLPADVQPLPLHVSAPDKVRAYGLVSGTRSAAYLWHFAGHSDSVQVTVDLPGSGRRGKAEWIDPSTARSLAVVAVSRQTRRLQTPRFTADLALLVDYNSEN